MTSGPTVEYHILLSQSYRVPMLYFFLHKLPIKGPKGIDAVYEYLVPHQYRSGLRDLGVMGGISMGVSDPLIFDQSDVADNIRAESPHLRRSSIFCPSM